MNTKKIAIASTVGAFAVVALLFAFPAMAASTSPNSVNPQKLLQQSPKLGSQQLGFSTGQTITLTSVVGGFWVVGDRATNGTASGTMTLQVSADLKGGYIFTVTGGSLTINGTAYTISGGSAEAGPRGYYIVGNGHAGSAQFLFMERGIGKFGNTNFGVLRVDLQDGSSEFAARLLTSISA